MLVSSGAIAGGGAAALGMKGKSQQSLRKSRPVQLWGQARLMTIYQKLGNTIRWVA